MNNNPFKGALDAHFDNEYEAYYHIGPLLSEEEIRELLEFLNQEKKE